MADKYATIDSLSNALREVEESYCYALREGDREAARELYYIRGGIIWDLQNVK